MSRKRSTNAKQPVLDIALLTCGIVDVEIFEKCVAAIREEMNDIQAVLHVNMNGLDASVKQKFWNIVGDADVFATERTGFSAGANKVMRRGIAPLILFVTDDVVLHKGTASRLLERMNDPQWGLCGLKLLFAESDTDQSHPAGRVQHIGHGFDSNMECVHPLIGWKPDNPKCCVSREVQSVTGAAFIVRRNLFTQVRGFYEGYGLGYYEDADLCFAVRSTGTRIHIDAEAVATHYTNSSMIKSGLPIPMTENKMLFRKRWGKYILPDTFTFW